MGRSPVSKEGGGDICILMIISHVCGCQVSKLVEEGGGRHGFAALFTSLQHPRVLSTHPWPGTVGVLHPHDAEPCDGVTPLRNGMHEFGWGAPT